MENRLRRASGPVNLQPFRYIHNPSVLHILSGVTTCVILFQGSNTVTTFQKWRTCPTCPTGWQRTASPSLTAAKTTNCCQTKPRGSSVTATCASTSPRTWWCINNKVSTKWLSKKFQEYNGIHQTEQAHLAKPSLEIWSVLWPWCGWTWWHCDTLGCFL